jgi:hypothetical protein
MGCCHMAWFIVFGKPDCDLEFSKSNGQEMAMSFVFG